MSVPSAGPSGLQTAAGLGASSVGGGPLLPSACCGRGPCRVAVGRWRTLGCQREPTPPPRRTLAGLPRVLRAPCRELLDEHRAAHQRRLRLHLDAHQHAARRGSRPTSSWPSTSRARRSAPRSTPSTRPAARARPTSSQGQLPLVKEILDALRIRFVELDGLRGRRHHRDDRHAGRGQGRRGAHLLG